MREICFSFMCGRGSRKRRKGEKKIEKGKKGKYVREMIPLPSFPFLLFFPFYIE